MINLYTNHPTSSFVMYPDTDFSASSDTVYQLVVSQDLDRSTTTISNLKRLNTYVRNNLSDVYIFEAYSGSIPNPDGQYSTQLFGGKNLKETWGTYHTQFTNAHQKWSDVSTFSGSVIADDRAYVHGGNTQTITTYTGTNQDGAYTTYNS